MEVVSSLPHSQQATTSTYPSQINPFLCPSHFWQAQLVSFLVGLRTYQHHFVLLCVYIYIYREREREREKAIPLHVLATRVQDNRHTKGVSLSALRTGHLYPQQMVLVPICVRGWVNSRVIVRPEGLCQWNFPMMPFGIESEPIRLVALCLKELRHRVSNQYIYIYPLNATTCS